MRSKTFLFAFAPLIMAGCTPISPSPSAWQQAHPSTSETQAVRSLRWLDSADPRRDLSASLARGDTRFLGIHGYTSFVPGVDRSIASHHGVRYLDGTSDAIRGPEHARLNRLASTCAERYNKLLLEHLKP